MTGSGARTPFTAVLLAVGALSLGQLIAACTPPPPLNSGSSCWEKRAFYQARNLGLKETLGSGTSYSTPCVPGRLSGH